MEQTFGSAGEGAYSSNSAQERPRERVEGVGPAEEDFSYRKRFLLHVIMCLLFLALSLPRGSTVPRRSSLELRVASTT